MLDLHGIGVIERGGLTEAISLLKRLLPQRRMG